MAIDLSKIEDANLREELRAQIKADKQQAIQDRLARVKTDEELEAKLAKLKEFEESAAKAKELELKEVKAKEADDFLSKNNLSDVEGFKQLKAHDTFLKLETDEERTKFLKDLKEKSPRLFSKSKSVLDFSNIELKTKQKEEIYKVY